MTELTDDEINDLYYLPFRIAEQSLYFDAMDVDVDIIGFGPYIRGAEYKIELLLLVVTRRLGNPDNDIVQIPIQYSNVIMSDKLNVRRDMLMKIEVESIDRHISDFVKERLSEIRTPSVHIEQLTFMRIERGRRDIPA